MLYVPLAVDVSNPRISLDPASNADQKERPQQNDDTLNSVGTTPSGEHSTPSLLAEHNLEEGDTFCGCDSCDYFHT